MSDVLKMINFVKTIDDHDQLIAITEYFSDANSALKNSVSDTRKQIVETISSDLKLKLYPDQTLVFSFESFESFTNEAEVMISATIKGEKKNGKYRLFWAPYYGGDVEAIIKKKAFKGHSATLESPFLMAIHVPSYVTFWLVNTNDETIYRPDTDYFILKGSNKEIGINFLPL